MNSFYMPTKIFSGENIIQENYKEFIKLGKKALIVTGRGSSKKNGSLQDVQEALNRASIGYIIFDEIEENPSLETIEKAGELGRKEKIDFIIGIGGGSPLDSSKVIGILVKNTSICGEDVFLKPNLKSVDIVAVPTTSGTGSEVTQYAIVTLHKEKTKKNYGQSIFPIISFLDPRYTLETPLKITVNTAVDAFSHLVEGYLNKNANILTDAIAETGMKIWGECIDSLLSGNLDIKIREKLMFASTLGGILIAQTGTSLPHGMGYALTYNKDLPHGLANGVLYVEYLRVFKYREKVDKIHKILGIDSYEKFEEILRKLTKVQINLTDVEIEEYARGMIENKGKLANHPEEITYEELLNIYKRSFQ
ncbi:iron-containing alcohol dehydrogenase family protein [Clostridium paridis]|uniref:Iron-containing alcohol dehydrogenase n=1 Tax=Clostridium paridis TaxID=2803863 RepID=A0A937FJ95_9CLOT|nr:iron-containing alcohol dehydrogenase family protein [Clostridium paridis]MBL4932526.1 iron-containing alcohol dehydrogenase [Clostridium paridis]